MMVVVSDLGERFDLSDRSPFASRAERIIKRHPQITPTELAKRAQISRSYASQLLAQHSA
jgi:DNA-binding MarR family transcriptional regulator